MSGKETAAQDANFMRVPISSGHLERASRPLRRQRSWWTLWQLDGPASQVLLVLLLALFNASIAWAGKLPLQPVSLHAGFEEPLDMTRYALVYEDISGQRTAEEVASLPPSAFRRAEDMTHTFGYGAVTYWFRFELDYQPKRPNTSSEFFVRNNFALLDEIDIHFRRANGEIETWQLGDQRPFSNNRFTFPRPIAGLVLDGPERLQVLVRVYSAGSKVVHLYLDSEQSIQDYLLMEGAFLSAFYAIMLALVCYNFFVFLAVRQTAYFHYVLAISGFVFAQACIDSLPWAIGLFESAFWINQILPASICATWVLAFLFVRSFLRTRDYAPVADIAIRVVMVFFAWWTILAPVLDYGVYIRVASQATVLACVLVSLASAWVWVRGHHLGAYFMGAWLVYLAGSGLLVFNTLGVVDTGWVGLHSAQLGAIGNVMLLSLALADNINVQRKALEVASRMAERSRLDALRANEVARVNMQRFRQIWEDAREGIFQFLASGRILSANPALARILGYETSEDLIAAVEHVPRDLVVSPRHRRQFLLQLARDGYVIDLETRLWRRDRSQFWGACSAHVVRDHRGRLMYIEGSVVDISERIDKEKAQREREAAEATAAARSEFLANMSHEIRTPMNAILGFTDLAMRDQITERQRTYLSRIHTSARNLLDIVNDILDFSKIEAGQMRLERTAFNLNRTLAHVVELFAHRAAEKRLDLSTCIDADVPVSLIGDPLRLGQVLINLTSNAIKFTERGEVILSVALERTRRSASTEIPSLAGPVDDSSEAVTGDADLESMVVTRNIDGDVGTERRADTPTDSVQPACTLRFSVKDTGIGISEKAQGNLFSPFTQADSSTTRQFGGTGLGLSISRQIVALMSGLIDLESEEGRGSTFTFTAEFGCESESSLPSPETNLKTRSLLWISADNAAAGCRIGSLEKCGARVTQHVISSQDELHLAELSALEVPDLIVCEEVKDRLFTDALVERLKGVFPDRPLLLLVFAADQWWDLARAHSAIHLLEKPCAEYVLQMAVAGMFTSPAEGLPLQPVTANTATPLLAGRRVLLVEDTWLNQELAKEYLTGFGMQVELAENGEVAIEKVVAHTYDLVLMDCQMPVMDGYAATERIRLRFGPDRLPIVAMTANAMPGDREKCLAAGMNDYLSKPIDVDVLRNTLERLFATQPSRRSDLSSIQASRGGFADRGSPADNGDLGPQQGPSPPLAKAEMAAGDDLITFDHLMDQLDAGRMEELGNLLSLLQARAVAENRLPLARALHEALSDSEPTKEGMEALLYRIEPALQELLPCPLDAQTESGTRRW